MTAEKVLIVEDEENERNGLAELIGAWGYKTETARDGVEGLEKLESWNPGIVVTDLKMPRMDGMELLEHVAAQPRQVAVVLLTAAGSVDAAVSAMKIGAFDFIEKPVNAARLRNILLNASRIRGAERELEASRRKLRDVGVLGSLVGPSKKMQEVFRLVEMVAPSTASVLITGESGTGKELVARTIHSLSKRKLKPFVAINCAAIPETLIESEIFGHEKGAFTGALERRTGCFELAEGGTLLLDEIGEMPIATQAKLLRVLEDRKLRRLGSTSETSVDVRVLAATNKPPEEAVARGQLRNDLFYRLNVFNVNLPPLREHKEDLADLVHALLADMNEKHDRRVAGVSEAVMTRVRGERLARQCSRIAQYPGARCDRVRLPYGGNEAPAARFRPGGPARSCAGGQCRAARSWYHRGRGRAAAHPENAGSDPQQQDAGRGNPRHQPEDPAQQVERVRRAERQRRRRSGQLKVRYSLFVLLLFAYGWLTFWRNAKGERLTADSDC